MDIYFSNAFISGLYFVSWILGFSYYFVNGKVTVMQIEKTLINDSLVFQKYVENFAFQLITIL